MNFNNSNSIVNKKQENMAMLGHKKQLFTLPTPTWSVKIPWLSITSWQVQIYFTWFYFSWTSWTKKRHSYCIHGCYCRFKQKNRMCKSFISIIEVPFCILCHHYNFIKLYPSVDSNIFRRLQANIHILNFNKAIAMRFSQNKAWYPILNT